MRPPRGIFVKLVAVFLLIGLVPFLVIGLAIYQKAKARMTETVVEYWLVRTARETAVQLDREVQEMRALTRSWADDDFLAARLARTVTNGVVDLESAERLTRFLNIRRNYRRDLDLLLIIDSEGRIVAESWSTRGGESGQKGRLEGRRIDEVLDDPAERQWIENALRPTPAAIGQDRVPISTRDWHVSPLVLAARGEPPWDFAAGYPKHDEDYDLGFASTILGEDRSRPIGAFVALFNWSRIQGVLDQVGARFKDPQDPIRRGSPRYRTGYPFLFASDLDTIIAHHFKQLLGNSLTRDHSLFLLRERMAQAPYGSHQYEYPPGTPKISGFAHTAAPLDEGFGWTVGVGINHEEILADVYALRDFLVASGLLVTGLVILAAALLSLRITKPITRLIAYTEEVARGNLDARVDIKTRDEIAVLADSFNRMAEDLKESNQRLIKAEKDAAWKEMARQVAHEIKNPLTPILLSVQQLKQAHQDRHPLFDELLEDSVETVIDQCEALRRIAAEFADFAAFPKRNLEAVPVEELLAGAVEPYRASLAHGIEVTLDIRTSAETTVLADRSEIRRVLLNLFNNAMEAMTQSRGKLTVSAELADVGPRPMVAIRVADTGSGIPEEARARIFEPYFSARTGGTGLGLAISKKIVEEHGGSIEFQSEIGRGTTFKILLPRANIR